MRRSGPSVAFLALLGVALLALVGADTAAERPGEPDAQTDHGATIEVGPPERCALRADVLELLHDDQEIAAVKTVRSVLKVGLRDAKAYVDRVRALEQRTPSEADAEVSETCP